MVATITRVNIPGEKNSTHSYIPLYKLSALTINNGRVFSEMVDNAISGLEPKV